MDGLELDALHDLFRNLLNRTTKAYFWNVGNLDKIRLEYVYIIKRFQSLWWNMVILDLPYGYIW